MKQRQILPVWPEFGGIPIACGECALKWITETEIEDRRFLFLNPIEALCTPNSAA